MKATQYQGNSAYCYSNCTSMLLATIGEDIKPSFIEVIGGVGIGAFVLPNSKIAFLSNFSGLPDQAISKVLDILGFSYEESHSEKSEDFSKEDLVNLVNKGSVLLGPVDMGYLVYNPKHKQDMGIDHYVFATGIVRDKIRLHDPAGYPSVLIDPENLLRAWEAEKIGYKRGHYRHWKNPKRISKPTDDEVFSAVLKSLKNTYEDGEKYGKKRERLIDSEAILFMADNIEKNDLNDGELNTLQTFVFKLGARRALDFADYFSHYNKDLSSIKQKQSEILGACHYLSVVAETGELAKTIREYEKLESQFKKLILEK